MKRRNSSQDVRPSVATHFLSLSRSQDMDPDVHMFTEDIHLAVMPFDGRVGNQENFSVEFQGTQPDCKRAQEIVGELGEFDKHNATEMVCDAVENIARNLAREGQAVHEIITNKEQIHIRRFTSKNFFRLLFWYLQIIPPGDWDLWKRKFTLLNKEKIWRVEMPSELGGLRGFKKVLKRLRRYNHLGPSFYKQNLGRGLTITNNDSIKYIRNSEIYFNRVTRIWGWNRRDFSQKKCTEFYTFYKVLNSRHAQAILRVHIIKEINQLLERLSVKCKIVVNGLPTPKEILQIRNDMQKGDIPFTEAYDKVAIKNL